MSDDTKNYDDAVTALTGAFDTLQSSEVDEVSGKKLNKQGIRTMVHAVQDFATAQFGQDWREVPADVRATQWEHINKHVFGTAEQEYCKTVYGALIRQRDHQDMSSDDIAIAANYDHVTDAMVDAMMNSDCTYKMKFRWNNAEIRIIPNSVNTYKNAMKNAYIRGDLSPEMESKNHMATGSKNSDKSEEDRFLDNLRTLKNRIAKQQDSGTRKSWIDTALDTLNNIPRGN